MTSFIVVTFNRIIDNTVELCETTRQNFEFVIINGYNFVKRPNFLLYVTSFLVSKCNVILEYSIILFLKFVKDELLAFDNLQQTGF